MTSIATAILFCNNIKHHNETTIAEQVIAKLIPP